MTEATYAAWRAGWEALAPVRVGGGDELEHGRYFRDRLSADTHAQLLEGWRTELAVREAKKKHAAAIERKLAALRRSGSPEILEVAEEARGVLEVESLFGQVLEPLAELISTGRVKPEVGLVWLDYAEEANAWRERQLAIGAAAVAAVSGDPQRALALLRLAFTDYRGRFGMDPARKRELKRDKKFASLRTLTAWKKMVG